MKTSLLTKIMVVGLVFFVFCSKKDLKGLFGKGCEDRKGGQHESKAFVIDTTVKSGQAFVFSLKPYQDKDDLVKIDTQASNYEQSEVVRQGDGTYDFVFKSTYVNGVKFTSPNVQKVVVKLYEPSDHAVYEETLITFNISILP